MIFAKPRIIEKKEEITPKLAELLQIDPLEIDKKLSNRASYYQVLKHKVDKETALKIKELNASGIGLQEETFRFYPEKNIASHLLGFVGHSDSQKIGRYGLEGYFNDELAGSFGEIKSQRDALGYLIFVDDYEIKEAIAGDDLVLTLDHSIQFAACSKLAETVKKHGADGGTVVILEPASGAILAMCSLPDFDPNQYNQVEDISQFNNPATFFQYEPGRALRSDEDA